GHPSSVRLQVILVSILNSLMVITFLTSIFLVIFLRTGRQNLTRYEELDKDAQAHMNEELSWVMLCGLHQTIRSCVQILGMVLVTILFDIRWFTWNTLRVYSSYASFLVLMMPQYWRTFLFFFYLSSSSSCGFASHSNQWLFWSLTLNFHFEPNKSLKKSQSKNTHHGFSFLALEHFHLGPYSSSLFSSWPASRWAFSTKFLFVIMILLVVNMYSFIYSINYLGFNIKSLSRPVSATLYHGYSLVIVLAIMHATITIGFMS
ncbi:hypothetical protein HID58_029080, partial [Brassica napus]